MTLRVSLALTFILAALLALILIASSPAAPPLPDGPDGKAVKPTVSYSYQWFATDGRAGIQRVPVRGHRRFTLRTGGPMGEPDTGPVSSWAGGRSNMDPGSGGYYYYPAHDANGNLIWCSGGLILYGVYLTPGGYLIGYQCR